MIRIGRPGREGIVRVTFVLPADEPAGAVSVVGDFNGWSPFVHPLRRRTNGTRSVAVTASSGSTLCFRYLGENGLWFDDDAVDHHDSRGGLVRV